MKTGPVLTTCAPCSHTHKGKGAGFQRPRTPCPLQGLAWLRHCVLRHMSPAALVGLQAYMGDRTKDALVAFADSLVPSAGQPHLRHGQLKAAPRTPGCNVAGRAAADGCRGRGHRPELLAGAYVQHTPSCVDRVTGCFPCCLICGSGLEHVFVLLY